MYTVLSQKRRAVDQESVLSMRLDAPLFECRSRGRKQILTIV